MPNAPTPAKKTPKTRTWIVRRPNGKWEDVIGPAHEPPICCGATPPEVPSKDGFVGDRECGKCDSRWLP